MDEQPRPYHALKAIPDVDQRILAEIAQGKSLKRIADELEVSDSAVFARVQQYPEYKQRQKIGLEIRAATREQELENAASNVDVTRADRLLGHARWLLERCVPEQYGAKTQIQGDLTVNVVIQDQFIHTIDTEPTQVIDNT